MYYKAGAARELSLVCIAFQKSHMFEKSDKYVHSTYVLQNAASEGFPMSAVGVFYIQLFFHIAITAAAALGRTGVLCDSMSVDFLALYYTEACVQNKQNKGNREG